MHEHHLALSAIPVGHPGERLGSARDAARRGADPQARANPAGGPAQGVRGVHGRGPARSWWGPVGFSIPTIEFDPRVGGSYRIEMKPPEGDPFALIGEFHAVEPPERLLFGFIWEEPDPDDVEMVAELFFEDRGESARVALRQGPFRTRPGGSSILDGWDERSTSSLPGCRG